MKIRVTMKDPDTLHDAIDRAVKDSQRPHDIDDDEWEYLRGLRSDQVKKFAARWFKHGEYLVVELDTDTETCTVVSQ